MRADRPAGRDVRRPDTRGADRRTLMGLLAVLVLLVLWVDASGDFAINDDWGYSSPVRWLVEDGLTELTFWQSMPLFPQIGLGALWSYVFGFSQEGLRLLGVSLAGVCVLSLYGIARLVGAGSGLAGVVALLPLASPIFVTLSFSFMTDVSGLALMLLATLAFATAFRLQGRCAAAAYLAGTVFCLAAVMLRQTALGLPMALVLAEAVRQRLRLRALGPPLAVLGASVALLAADHVLLRAYDAVPAAYHLKTQGMGRVLSDLLAGRLGALRPALEASVHMLLYTGLFLLPAAPLFWGYFRQNPMRRAAPVVAGLAAALWAAAWGLERIVLAGPKGDVWTLRGTGPALIEGVYGAPVLAGFVLTGISAVVLATALVASVRGLQETGDVPERGALLVLLGAAGILSYAPHGVVYAALFDRYTLTPAIYFSLVLTTLLAGQGLRVGPSQLWGLGVGLLAAAVLAQDHLSWQRARYAAIHEIVVAKGIAPDRIDGGFEYNNLAAVLAAPRAADQGALVVAEDRPVVVTATRPPPQMLILEVSVPQFFGFARRDIFITRRP